MSVPSLSNIETLKKWYDYWRTFKGKKVIVRIKENGKWKKKDFKGTISEVIQEPLGIMLTDISSEKLEKIFLPMSEIARIGFLKQELTSTVLKKP